MSPEAPTKDYPLASDDPALHPGWVLLEFLASIGADEFAVTFMYAGADGEQACDRLADALAFASLGERMREGTVAYSNDGYVRSVETWRFDPAALIALRTVMPNGILDSSASKSAWAEHLCVYRRDELVLGTVTHERYAFLRLTEAEWRQWEVQNAARP